MENLNNDLIDDYKESISEVQEAIKDTLGVKNSQHPGVVGSILQGMQLKRIADLMEMNHLDSQAEDDSEEDFEEEEEEENE